VRTRLVIVTVILAALLGACSSGPSEAALTADRKPTTTTTTEAPPEGIAVVTIESGRFRPSNLKLDLDNEWIVEWRQEDSADREYVVVSGDDSFADSPTLKAGDTFQVDFSQLPPGIYRYYAYLGNNRIPGSVDTRPSQ
jgi:plastocyanin